MGFPTKSEREQCWGAKDKLWDCLDQNNQKSEMCEEFRKVYESSCTAQWVKHFDRRRQYEKFKSAMEKREWKDPLEDKR